MILIALGNTRVQTKSVTTVKTMMAMAPQTAMMMNARMTQAVPLPKRNVTTVKMMIAMVIPTATIQTVMASLPAMKKKPTAETALTTTAMGSTIVTTRTVTASHPVMLPRPAADVVGGAFEAAVVLHEGHNILVVSATNEGGTGTDSITVTSTVDLVHMLVTLVWEGAADLDLYITQPTTETAWYGDQTTTEGGFLDVDNVTAFGPENFSYPDSTSPPIGIYEVNVHYYRGSTAQEYEVIVLLNEGTAYETRQTFVGIVTNDNSSSAGPDDIRSDNAWGNYDAGITTFPNPYDGSTAYGLPVVRIEHDPTATPPFFVIPTP